MLPLAIESQVQPAYPGGEIEPAARLPLIRVLGPQLAHAGRDAGEPVRAARVGDRLWNPAVLGDIDAGPGDRGAVRSQDLSGDRGPPPEDDLDVVGALTGSEGYPCPGFAQIPRRLDPEIGGSRPR